MERGVRCSPHADRRWLAIAPVPADRYADWAMRFVTRARLAVMLIVASTACSPEVVTYQLDWEIVFPADAPAVRERTAIVIATISEGQCDGSALYESDLRPDGSTRAPRPPRLPAGRYAFHARARDASCVELAAGCVVVDVPLSNDATLSVPLRAHPVEPPAACVEGCSFGACPAPDASSEPDAGPDRDAAPRDAGALGDATVADAGPGDAGPPPDAGPPCEGCCFTDVDCDGVPCCDGWCGFQRTGSECPYSGWTTCAGGGTCRETVAGEGACVSCESGATCEYEYTGSGGIYLDCETAASCSLDVSPGACCVVYCGAFADCSDVDSACTVIRT